MKLLLYKLAIKYNCVSAYWRFSEVFFIFNLNISLCFIPFAFLRGFVRRSFRGIRKYRSSTKFFNWSLFFKNLIELLNIKFILLITGLFIVLSIILINISLILNDINSIYIYDYTGGTISISLKTSSGYLELKPSLILGYFHNCFIFDPMVIMLAKSTLKKFLNYLVIIINFILIVHIFLGFLGLIYDYILKKFEIFKLRRKLQFLFNNYFIFVFLIILLFLNIKYIIIFFI